MNEIYLKLLLLSLLQCNDWQSNKNLFGCSDKTKVDPELKNLCDNPKIDSTAKYNKEIYIFRGGKYWKFDDKTRNKLPLGQLIEGPIDAKEKWPGIKLPAAMGQNGDNFFTVIKNKYQEWHPNGTKVGNEKQIEEKPLEPPDEADGNPDDAGALLCLTDKLWAKIKNNEVCYASPKKKRLYWEGCLPVTEDDHQFPPNIIAAVKTANDVWYYFDKEAKHCKRQEGDYSRVSIIQ